MESEGELTTEESPDVVDLHAHEETLTDFEDDSIDNSDELDLSELVASVHDPFLFVGSALGETPTHASLSNHILQTSANPFESVFLTVSLIHILDRPALN